jgi:hypothetical protein
MCPATGMVGNILFQYMLMCLIFFFDKFVMMSVIRHGLNFFFFLIKNKTILRLNVYFVKKTKKPNYILKILCIYLIK